MPKAKPVYDGRMSDGGVLSIEASRYLIGTWRRFGEVGPVYGIIGTGAMAPDGAVLMRIRVLETDEEIDYPLRRILDDPEAA